MCLLLCVHPRAPHAPTTRAREPLPLPPNIHHSSGSDTGTGAEAGTALRSLSTHRHVGQCSVIFKVNLD